MRARSGRHGRQGKRVRIQWDRVGRIALVLVIGFVLASYVQPLMSYWEQHNAAKRKRAELGALERENSALKLEIRQQNDSRMLELQARRLGMVRPGERLYIIEGLTKSLSR